MATFTQECNHEIIISHAVQQMFKGQDLIRQGTVGEMKWVMLNDGHGSDACINCLRSLSQDQLDKIIASSTPIESLATKIDETIKITQKDLSGATCVIARIYPSHIELISSGDSQFIVFKNKELIYVSKEHNCKSNNDEYANDRNNSRKLSRLIVPIIVVQGCFILAERCFP
jgi:serine/threonine protein phosphatase PrpC